MSWVLRRGVEDNIPTAAALVVALVAAGITVATAWLGGELVDRLGVGVDDDAHLDASPRTTTGAFLRRDQRAATGGWPLGRPARRLARSYDGDGAARAVKERLRSRVTLRRSPTAGGS